MTYSLKEIKEIIRKDKEEKQGKYYARRYYNYKPSALFPNTSTSYEKDIVDESGKVITITKERQPNLNTNFTKLLVNQKIDYMLANEPTIKVPNQYTIVEIADMMEDMSLTASLDVLSWLFFYVKDNVLKWVLVPDCQIKPIYDDFGVEIVQIIRYYDIDKITHVEIWDLTGVRTLKYTSENQNAIIDDKIKTHYTEKIYYNNEVISEEAKNLPFIPFICMKNNKNLENDIECIKDQLDFYDIITSGFISNIFKFQEMLMKLQGFTGDDKFYDDTMKKMQKYKMICLPDKNETDAEYISVEIPTEAREIILTALRENIFKIGQGFDPDKIGDGNITNIVIINRYSALDSKANKTIKQLKIFYQSFIDCINKFYYTQLSSDLTCNKSANWNESEIIDNCVKSVDIIPDEIIIENHPWIVDSQKSIKMMKKQKEDNLKIFNNDTQVLGNEDD